MATAVPSTSSVQGIGSSTKTENINSPRSVLKQSTLDEYNFSSLRISKTESTFKTSIDDENRRIEKAIKEKSEHEETFSLFRKSPDYKVGEDDPEYVKRTDIIAIRRNTKYYDDRVKEIRAWGNDTNSKAESILELPLNNSVEIFSDVKEAIRKSYPNEFEFHSTTGIEIIAHNTEKERLENKLIAIVKKIYNTNMRHYIIKKEEPISKGD